MVRDDGLVRTTQPKRRSLLKAVKQVTHGKIPRSGSTPEGSTREAPGSQGPSPADLAGSTRARGADVGVPAPQVTGAQSLVMALEAIGVDTVFGIPGGAILPAYDPLLDSTKVRHILVRHEQGAGHAAEGYASASGKVGVCMATSGPGATNLVTPIADAYMDSVPIVAITGQVTSKFIGTDAFQEADIRGITMPISKHNYLITDASAIPRAIAEAFHIASTGRPGPVLVDISKDALTAQTTFVWPPKLDLPGYRPVSKPHGKQIRQAARLIREAHRPVLYVGGGVIRSRASDLLRELLDLTQIPVVTTLMARGAVPDSHPLNLGMPGMHGTVAAVTALQKSDLLITLGARFDDRVTGQLSTFAPGAKVIHADIDPAEISKNRVADVPIVGDCKDVISDLIVALRDEDEAGHPGDYEAWRTQVADWKATFPPGYSTEGESLSPQYVIERIGAISGPESVFVAGVGQHQMWAAQFVRYERPNSWINSGGLGTMGFCVPAAMGAKVAQPERTVWAIDGGRLLPDDQPGARDLRHQQDPDQSRDHQQLQPGHGPPVADALLQRALLQHRPAHQPPAGAGA
jgi:acetolactate synthase-1/2/3 large subunit